MNYYLALDGGGTKTEAAVINEYGHIVLHRRYRGCNPMDYGVEDTREHVSRVVSEMLGAAPGHVCSIYAGIAGVNRIESGLTPLLKSKFDAEFIRTEADGFSMISAELGHADGCGMVCGTGSSLFLRIDGRESLVIGGYGYLIDTGGSGFEIGRAGIRAACAFHDGRGPVTVLLKSLEKELGSGIENSMEKIYAGGRSFIASLSHLVFEGAGSGDAVCRKIVGEGAAYLAETIWAAAPRFEGNFTVVMNGGVLRANPGYVELIKEKAPAKAELIFGTTPPVYGGLVEAMWQSGKAATPQIRAAFMADYAGIG